MKKMKLVALCILLTSPLVIKSSSQDLAEKSNEIKTDIQNIKTAIQDKQDSADFSNKELKNKQSELQTKIQDFIQLLAANMPNGTSDEQKAEKANLLDQKNYFKIQLQSLVPPLQAKMVYIQACITAKTSQLNGLKNRSSMLTSMLTTNKDNGVIMSPTRSTNIKDQQTAIEKDITEAQTEKTKLEAQLKDVTNSLAQLKKFLNNISIN